MNSKAAALLLIGGISLLAASIPRRHSHPPARRAHKTERPWLSHDAQDQLIGANGEPGPLFAGVTLGGPDPSTEQRAQIAAFAKANDIDIRLEVRDDTLVAIRASITFGGCCGYEAVDVLGLRLSRPRIYHCGDCNDYVPVNDWAYEPEPGVHVRFHTHVNTLAVRWEPALSTDETLDAVEALIGTPIGKLRRTAGDRLTEIESNDFVLELPYDTERPPFEGSRQLGMAVHTHAGVVTRVDLDVFAPEPNRDSVDEPSSDSVDEPSPIEEVLRARYGSPHVIADTGDWSWHRHGHVITASTSRYAARATLTIEAPGELAGQ